MDRRPKRLAASWYETATGVEPGHEWLKGLSAEDRKIVGDDIAKLQFGWLVGMPVCRPMGGGLFEIRSTLPGHRLARVLVCTAKVSSSCCTASRRRRNKTPASDLALAKKRMKEIEE